MKRPWALLILICVTNCVAGGCTYVNKPLNRADLPHGPRKTNNSRAALAAQITSVAAPADGISDVKISPSTTQSTHFDSNDDGYFVGISISGGGSRSANFAAACMFELQKLGLLQRTDYISTVSGGSLAGALYCVSDDNEWNTAEVQKKLTHSFASDVVWSTVLPWNFVALTFGDWDRSDLLAGSFRKVLFTRDGKELTFADLRPDRPHLLLNSTDLQSGKSFVFCNETFEQLNSNLSQYPLAHAVAASSAVPVLLHQVTLRDFSTTFKQYRHLVDGGVVDNLGVKMLVETYRAQLKASGNTVFPRGAVFFVIDARTTYDAKLSSKGDTGLLATLQFGAGVTSTVLLNRASSATLAELILESAPNDMSSKDLRANRDKLMDEGYVHMIDIDGRPVHVVHLALSRLDDLSDLPFKTFNESVNNIATYFNIDPTEAYHLYQAAGLLVQKRFNNELTEIADELSGGPTSRPVQ